MDAETPGEHTLPCPRCGVRLDASGFAPDTWLTCPGCGQPVRVRPIGAVRRQAASPARAEPPSAVAEVPSPAPDSPGRGTIEAEGTGRAGGRVGGLQIVMLVILAGVANTMLIGSFLMVTNPRDLAMCWFAGASIGLFVAVMVNTMRWGGSSERQGRP